jgi:hypothetical protein
MATCESHGHLYGHGGTCVMCKEPKPAPQQEQAARFMVDLEGDILDKRQCRFLRIRSVGHATEGDFAYARAIAAALNASPPKEAM